MLNVLIYKFFHALYTFGIASIIFYFFILRFCYLNFGGKCRAAHAKAGTKDFVLSMRGIEESISLLKMGIACKDDTVDETMRDAGRDNIEELNRLLEHASSITTTRRS